MGATESAMKLGIADGGCHGLEALEAQPEDERPGSHADPYRQEALVQCPETFAGDGLLQAVPRRLVV